MLETVRPRHREAFDPGPGNQNDIFGNCATGGLVTVHHGHYMEQLPVGNMTVREIRARYADRLDIHPETQAQLDGRHASDDTVVRTGQILMFVRQAGEKGAGR